MLQYYYVIIDDPKHALRELGMKCLFQDFQNLYWFKIEKI